jgi:hypothetical protein
MMNQLFAFMFMCLLQLCLGAVAPNVRVDKVADLAQYAWSSGIAGVVLITLGIFITFSGKRWFKIFLGASGFLTFAVLALALLSSVNELLVTIPHKFYVFWFFVGLAGFVGAYICYTMWEIGVLAAAGFGGYTLGVWIMSVKTGLLIQGYMTRGAIALAWLFDEMAIVLSSAISGSLTLVAGVDCFLNYGLVQILLSQLLPSLFPAPALNLYIYIELGAVAILAVVGVLVQLLSGTSKKGFAKSDRV